MKKSYIATHDYGSGGVLYRIFARSRSEVDEIFPEPSWKVFLESEKGCPVVPHDFNISESDIDEKSEWLMRHIWTSRRAAEGKTPFYISGSVSGKLTFLRIWARTEFEVRRAFPSFKSLAGTVMTQDMLNQVQERDIDSFHVVP